jgi:hypothetical protein
VGNANMCSGVEVSSQDLHTTTHIHIPLITRLSKALNTHFEMRFVCFSDRLKFRFMHFLVTV